MPNLELPQDFKDLITNLIKETDKDDITGETIKDYEQDKLWQYLVQYMKQEGEILGNYPIFQKNLGVDTLFQYINSTVDLDSKELPAGSYNFNKILDNLKQQIDNTNGTLNNEDGNYPWNESLTNALTYFIRYFDLKYIEDYENSNPIEYTSDKDINTKQPLNIIDTHGSIPIKNSSLKGGFRITDIKNADAGNSFNKIYPWVKPNYNIDAETYDKVRGIDKIIQVLESKKQMQFTHSQNKTDNKTINKYIRLLMPKYLRRVEVEDLNRNFWVIGQTIAAISAYLFDEDSPITKTFNNILNELVQLWENILYLWAALALISQKPYYTKVHTEVIYIPNDEYRDYYNFDNFDGTKVTSLEGCWNRVKYLKDSYSECHLCILPIVRENNYQHNYYSREKYYGIILYNRNTDAITYLKFNLNLDLSSSDELKKAVYAVHETEENYRYCSPFSEVNAKIEALSQRYYGLIRSIPTLNVTFNDDKILINSFSLALYDAGKKAVKGTNTRIALYSKDTKTWDSSTGDNSSNKIGSLNVTILTNSVVQADIINFKTVDIERGYYQGELISFCSNSSPKPNIDEIDVEEGYLGTIGEVNCDYKTFPSHSEVKALLKNYIGNSDINRIVLACFSTDQWEDGSQNFKGELFPGLMIYDPNEEEESKKYTYFKLGNNGLHFVISDYENYIYKKASTDNWANYGYYWTLPNGWTDMNTSASHYTEISGIYTNDGPELTKLIIYFYDNFKPAGCNKGEDYSITINEKKGTCCFVKYHFDTTNLDREATKYIVGKQAW